MTDDPIPLTPTSALAGIPTGLRGPLLDSFREIVVGFRERRWEPSELNGGKLSEVVYTILRGHVDGKFPSKPAKPRNMVEACRAFEKANASFPRSVRIQIPRMLIAIYEIRNNRGVGHVGGDVNPNHMDAVCVVQMAKWIIAELIRVFHNVGTDTAAAIVESLVDREMPLIWEVNGKRRVLSTQLSMRDKSLLLLHGEGAEAKEDDLVSWVEHSNPSVYRRDILRKAHRDRLIEYDEHRRTVQISPRGIEYVEETLLPSLS